MKKKRVLVTGGLGFLGSFLVNKLIEKKFSVTVFDDKSRGKLSRVNLLGLDKYIIGDIRKKSNFKKLKNNFDIIFHLAFINGTNFFYEKPRLVLDVGVRGILNIIDFAKTNKKCQFILASSSEVYNFPKKIPTDESTEILIPNILNPRFSYAGGKIISELITINYLKEYKIPFKIFRPHNVFGPDMGKNHVIPQIIEKVYNASNQFKKKKCKISIQGSGNETRAFCYILDAIEQIIYIQKKGKKNSIYNVGQKNEIKIKKLIGDIAKVLKIKIFIKSNKLLEGSVKRRCPNMKKLFDHKFKNKNNYINGLKTTVKWYKDFLLNEK